MTDESHTPGPWAMFGPFSLPEVNGRRDVWTVSAENDTHLIAEIYMSANARLMTAAPELLAALKAMDAWLADAFDADDPDMYLPELAQARAAIAKAEAANE